MLRLGIKQIIWCSLVLFSSLGADASLIADENSPKEKNSSAECNNKHVLRVLSYNIHHGEGVDGKLNLQRIAKVILSVKPDLVALQEVDQNVVRTNKVDQPRRLAELTKMKVAFAQNIPLQGGSYGNAILSRLPIKEHKNYLLPRFDNSEQRGCLLMQLRWPNDDSPLILMATHLDYRKPDKERVASVKKINALIQKHPDVPAILAGDLNDVSGSATLRELEKEWKRSNKQLQPTIPVQKPTRQIDFILIRPEQRWKVKQTIVLDEKIASDHRAILAILEWQGTSD